MKTLTLLLLTACGPDAFYYIPPLDSDAGDAQANLDAPDAARDGDAAPELDASDAGDATKTDGASCPYVGSVACSDTINAYCAHYASCCSQFPGNGNCSVGWSMASKCKTDLAQGNYDCNSSKFNKLVCGGPTACMNGTAGASCTTMFQSSGPDTFTGCPSFWGQF